MKNVAVLIMHGMSPKDFPDCEKKEFLRLKAQGDAILASPSEEGRRARELDDKMRRWPRHAQNDPFFFAAQELARALERLLGFDVVCGFNEFCAPSVQQAFDRAALLDPEEIIVVTPMMTRGGFHSETDIPREVREAQKRYPKLAFRYAWPFETSDIAAFLATQIQRSALSPIK